MKDELLALLDSQSPLKHSFSQFEIRPQQQKMLADIVENMEQQGIALIEAGTGTGKSLAYLLPVLRRALEKGETTVISTHTIPLQEQLVRKDLPQLMKALDVSVRVALVKGMNNFVCRRKVEDASEELPLETELLSWAQQTREGTLSDIPFSPSHSSWEKVNADPYACSGKDCHHFQECFFFKSRRFAQKAKIVVVNHHILLSDLLRRFLDGNYSHPAILPNYQHVIIDEAHHLEDVATEFFATSTSRLQFIKWLGKLTSDKQGKLAQLKLKLFNTDYTEILNTLQTTVPALRQEVIGAMNALFDALDEFTKEDTHRIRPQHYGNSRWDDQIVASLKALIEPLQKLTSTCEMTLTSLARKEKEKEKTTFDAIISDIQGLLTRLEEGLSCFRLMAKTFSEENQVRWIEKTKQRRQKNITLTDSPFDISEKMVSHLFSHFHSIALCSATLTTNQNFSFLKKRLGLHTFTDRPITESIYPSPFNFEENALLLVPNNIPNPSDPDYLDQIVPIITQTLNACSGNAFVLFTSHKMLQECHHKIQETCDEQGFALLKQGDTPRRQLIEKFRQTDRSVLLGTNSFWEGIDVIGDALRCVILVKLPFRVPTEPLTQARCEALTRQGDDPFRSFSIPHAIVKFKQGFGRLIRHRTDRGCILVLDPRLMTKPYGGLFLKSLPPCHHLFAPSGEIIEAMEGFYSGILT